jgi:excinuclease ABC subunit C
MKTKNPQLKTRVSGLPKSPGVYQFLNRDGEVIYVGKAKNLRSRVGQYFNGHDDRPQLPFLMAEAADFTYTVVDNELESAFLENTLIKKYLPRYNIMLRDDKNYAFIKIDYSTEIPQIGYARKIEPRPEFTNYTRMTRKGRTFNDSGNSDDIRIFGSRYFGPYSAAYKIRNTLNLVRKIFPFCSNKKVGSRPCFYYYMHRCPGVCIGKISLEEYNRHIEKIVKFLKGETGEITKEIKLEMKAAAKAKKFETAARLRDQLKSLELLQERQNVIMPKKVDWDIVSLGSFDGYACVNLFKVREGKLFDKENFVYSDTNPRMHPNDTNLAHSDNSDDIRILGSVMQKFLEQYYLESSGAPKEIFLQYPAADAELVKKIIRSRLNVSAKIKQAQRGRIAKLVKLGQTNAEEYLKNWLASQAGHLDKINSALNRLKDVLNLPQIPKRIECYDISNTQGTNPVGSMVVFADGLPAKSQYRKFKIQGKQTPDDFAMMREMLTRRLSRLQYSPPRIGGVSRQTGRGGISKAKNLPPPPRQGGGTPPVPGGEQTQWPTPDLIVIDGGKGQLGVAVDVFNTITDYALRIPIIGLAKRIEEIFVPGKSNPIILPHDDSALQLLQRLRDEAHRFGITFHRQLRSKQAVKSALDDITGIGPKIKKLLKAKFGTISGIRKAGDEELTKVVGKKLAETIKQNL